MMTFEYSCLVFLIITSVILILIVLYRCILILETWPISFKIVCYVSNFEDFIFNFNLGKSHEFQLEKSFFLLPHRFLLLSLLTAFGNSTQESNSG